MAEGDVLYREQDVRGAKLCEKCVEKNTEDDLRRWIDCRGLSTTKTETHASLVRRLRNKMKKILVAFDFDHTLVDSNSDAWVIQCAPEQSLPAWLENSYQRGRWTEYMGRVFTYIGDQSVRPDAIREVMQMIPFTDGMIDLLKFIYQSKSDIDCIIVSDSNTLFIDWILEAGGVTCAIDSVFSNPAKIDQRGYIEVRCFHSHSCERCPVNMCKQKVLSDFRDRQADAGVQYHTVCYVGDGSNDFCPVKILKEGDIAMPRKGYSLEKLLAKTRSESNAPKAQVIPWSSGTEILNQLKIIQKQAELF